MARAPAALASPHAAAQPPRDAPQVSSPRVPSLVARTPSITFHGRRVSPTSFYPLLAAAATPGRAAAMVRGWLLNASRFCVAPGGDFAGNGDACYWGLPSIAADDPAFPALGYWRGCDARLRTPG